MHSNIKKITAPLLLSGSMLMAGCMGSNPVSIGASGAGGSLAQLAAMHWQLQSLRNGVSAPTTQLQSGIPASRYQLSFSGDRIQLRGGCNLANGVVKFRGGGKMSVGPMMMTNRGCNQRLMQADAEVTNVLAQVSDYRLSGAVLSLLGARKILQFKGSPTAETTYGGKGERKFIDIRNTGQGLQWREAKYNSQWIRINKDAPWIKGGFPGIQGFKPGSNMEYTVRIKEFRDDTGKAVWIKDMITMQGVLG